MPLLPPGFPHGRLSAYYFCYFAFIGTFSPYFGLYLQARGFSAWDIGLLMSQMQLMRLFGPYVWGALSDRVARRMPIVRLAGGLSLIGFLSFFVVERFTGLLAAMAVLAFFWSAALPLVETVTFDHLREQSVRYSRIRLWGSVGFIAAVLGTGVALDRLPVDAVLWTGALVLGGILLCALLVPEASAHHGSGPVPAIRDILRRPRVRALLAACFAMSAAHGAFYVFFSIHLANHGYRTGVIGALWSLGVIAEIGVFLVMARLQRRFALGTILQACFVAAVLRFLLIGWAADSLAALLFAQLLHGLTFGAYHAAAIAAINRWFPGRCQARGQALYSSLSFGAGGLLGSVVSGWSWEAIGAPLTFTLGSLFALAGAFLVHRWVRDEPSPET